MFRALPTYVRVLHLLLSVHFFSGIEIHQDVIDHCHSSLKAWSSSHCPTNAPRSHPQIIRGNGLCISATVGESILGFDRIYIGAAIERSNLLHISKLLSPGGILVGPGKTCFKCVQSRGNNVVTIWHMFYYVYY
jgi:hypothetical protein